MSNPWYDYPVSQGYGVNGEQGVDIATPFHTPITDIYSGTVVQEGYGSAGGVVGILTNVPGLGPVVEYFLHLDLINVAMGQVVKAGQLVGLSGGENPGYPGGLHPASHQFSTGPHTEFGFFKKTPLFVGNSVGDPYPYLMSGATGSPLPNDIGTNAHFAVANTTGQQSSGGSDYFGGLLGGIGDFMGGFLPTNWFNGSGDNPLTGTVSLLNGITGGALAGGLQAIQNAASIAQELPTLFEEAGLFLLALMLVIVGIVLISHDENVPGQPVFQGLVKKGAKVIAE